MTVAETPPAARWLLALDSSTEQAGVALFDGRRLSEVTWEAGRTQTASLLRQVDHLLGLQGVPPAGLTAIGVATGPGAFSGLRVGMGVAKGLVLALGIPLIGVPTLDAAVACVSHTGGAAVSVVAAGRGRLVWAAYGTVDGALRQIAPPRNGTPADLLADAAASAPGLTVTGELTEAQARDLAALPGVVVPPVTSRLRRPGALAGLAWDRFTRGDHDNAATLEPLYLHGR